MATIGTVAISDVENELTAMLHGTSLNQVQDLYGVFFRAARRVLGDVDPQETKIISLFGKVYDGVYDYPMPVDVKGNKIIDLFPQANRQRSDSFQQEYNKEFDLTKNSSYTPDFTPRYSNGSRTLRINAPELNTGIQVNAGDGVNTNGLWVAGANVSNVQTNNQNFTDGAAGSVTFTLGQTGTASTAIITNSTQGPIDLTAHFNNADEFFNIYLPNAAGITSVVYEIGSSAGNYYLSPVVTTDLLGNAFSNGWNYLDIPFASFTTVGSPVISAISYLSVTIAYNGTLQTGVGLNQFYSRLGVLFMQEYYSKYLFRDAVTGVFQEQVTDPSNIVNLDTDGINLFLYASLGEITQQQQGLDALFYDAGQAEQMYQAELANYKGKYKSEVEKPHTMYYRNPSSGYRRYIGYPFP